MFYWKSLLSREVCKQYRQFSLTNSEIDSSFTFPVLFQDLELYEALVDVRCYELSALFLCSVFVPKCGPQGQLLYPCRTLCEGELRLLCWVELTQETFRVNCVLQKKKKFKILSYFLSCSMASTRC